MGAVRALAPSAPPTGRCAPLPHPCVRAAPSFWERDRGTEVIGLRRRNGRESEKRRKKRKEWKEKKRAAKKGEKKVRNRKRKGKKKVFEKGKDEKVESSGAVAGEKKIEYLWSDSRGKEEKSRTIGGGKSRTIGGGSR